MFDRNDYHGKLKVLCSRARKQSKIYRQEFGKEISDAEAYELAASLLRLFEIIYRPLFDEKGEEIGDNG